MTSPAQDADVTPPQEILAQVGRMLMGPMIWSRLSGGRTNAIWRGVSPSGDWVFKLFDESRANPLFPNDPKAEIAALCGLKGNDLAPEFVAQFATSKGPCLIYTYLPGASVAKTDGSVLRALGQLHALPAPLGIRQVDVSPSTLLADGNRFLNGQTTVFAKRLRSHRPALRDVPPMPPAFLHGDPTPANALSRGGMIRFVDWQCPALGDPTADLAIALSPAMHHVYGQAELSLADEMSALESYPNPEIVDRYRHLRPFFRWRMAAYCVWKATMGEEIYAQAAEAELSLEQAL